MKKRKQQSSQIGRRAMVALLVLAMLISVSVPSLTARASTVDMEPTETTTNPVETNPEETTIPTEAEPEEAAVPAETEPEETTIPTEAEPEETTVPAETEASEPTQAPLSEAAQDCMDRLAAARVKAEALTAETADLLVECTAVYNEVWAVAEAADAAWNEDLITDDEMAAINAEASSILSILTDLGVTDPVDDLAEVPDFSDITLVINDVIEETGRLTVTTKGELNGYMPVYTWYDQDGKAVERRDYTNENIVEYNVAEDGSWLNVAVAQGGKKTFTVKVTGYVTTDGNGNTIYAELPEENQSSSATYVVTYSNKLLNGSFESPSIEGKTAADFGGQLYPYNGTDYDHDQNQMQFLEGTAGLEWNTTSSCNSVEIINVAQNTSREDGSYNVGPTFGAHGVLFAADGKQAAELNSQAAGALYQDVLTVPGTTMHWQLQHMGRPVYGNINKNNDWPRLNGPLYNSVPANPDNTAKDTMYVLIMPTELAKNPGINGVTGEIDNQDEVNRAITAFANDSSVQIETITYEWYWVKTGDNVYEMYHKDNTGAWILTYTVNTSSNNRSVVQHADPWVVSRGDYDVQAETYLTRYFFVAGSTQFGGNNSVGNHIDNIFFGIDLPDPVEGSANLKVVKNLEGVAEEDLEAVKKGLQFDIVVGGQELTVYGYDDPTKDELHLSWNGLVGTYAKNYTVSGSVDYTVTETITSDAGNYKLESVKVNDQVVTGSSYVATGALQNKATETVTFTNTYTPATTPVTITKEVKGNMGDVNKEFPFEITVVNGTMADKTVAATDASVDYKVEGNVVSFSLKDGQKVVIQDVPLGATLTVKESGIAAYEMKIGETVVKEQSSAYTSATSSAIFVTEGLSITVTNTNDVTIDTGVSMDSLPYILLISVAAVGAIVLLLNKRRYSGKF